MSADSVRAAGGAIWRRAPSGEVEVLLIHRARYDDWSLPKGKAEPGEEAVETAIREVAEETGLHPEVGPELTSTAYRDHRGRDKVVRYWAMFVPGAPTVDDFEPNDEVDEVRWCPPDVARTLLSYLRDVAIIDELEAVFGSR